MGMASAEFYSGGSCGVSTELFGVSLEQGELGIEVSVIALLVIAVGLMTSVFNDRLNSLLQKKNDELAQQVARRTAQLSSTKEQIELILESIGEGVVVVGLDGKIQQANPVLEKMSGRGQDQLIGASLSTLFVETTEGDDLTSLLYQLSLPLKVLLEKERVLFEQFCEESPVALLLMTEQGVIESSNPAMKALTGWSAETITGGTLEPLLPEAMREHHRQLVEGFMKDPSPRKMGNRRLLPVVTADGEEKQLEIGLLPLPCEKQLLVLVVLNDLEDVRSWEMFKTSTLGRLTLETDDRVQLQYQLLQPEEEKLPVEITLGMLGQHQHGLSPTGAVLVLRDMSEQIKQRHQDQYAAFQASITEMSSTVLHNIGNVLTGMSGSVVSINQVVSDLELIIKGVGVMQKGVQNGTIDLDRVDQTLSALLEMVGKLCDGDSNDERPRGLRQQSQRLDAGLQHASEIITEFRQAATSEVRATRFNLHSFVIETLGLIEDRFERYHVELNMEVPEWIEMNIPRNLSMQMLLNLVKNSLEAVQQRREGEEALAGRVTVSAGAVDEGLVELVVTDNGCGISKEKQQEVLNYGYTTKETGSSGIGLHSIVKFAKSVRGEVAIESAGENCGATVRIILPVEAQESHS
ncbi:MAG: PAS domain S-box protein [Gammaproteobacteria bacterium]|nr:PAS domain S-box protein [Gammaproteobacteria bacterium]MBT5361481.1 PAS domain S-box protein [Gammaproteobacteria bacterium]MBT6669099.1 PAS domain S-box protein [Gammaproteobacteria bacterium]